MDLFQLTKEEYRTFLLSLEEIFKPKNINYLDNFGISMYVLDRHPDIYNNFLKGILFNDEINVFYNEYLETLYLFEYKYSEFFKKIVKDELLYSDLRHSIVENDIYAKCFLDIDIDVFNDFINDEKKNIDDFTKLISEEMDIKEIIEKSRQRNYY